MNAGDRAIVTISYEKKGYAYQVRLVVTDDAGAFAALEAAGVQDKGTEAMVKALIEKNTGYLAKAETFCNGHLIKVQNFNEQGREILPPQRKSQNKMEL